ncbi:MAG: 1-acyl-sn-glycerol-3-phosphate acyltransferase, partial [Rheinheimera sp.]|nr:1-acyl-sn-glycerol-3-phosphate acyltransferase [Rheinheimera sp.]
VHVAFAAPLTAIPSEPEQLAEVIDQQIWQQYRLFPINYLAAGQQHVSISSEVAELWQQRLQAVPTGAESLLSQLYAAPVQKLAQVGSVAAKQ